jgi:D-glycerate 3-kinase
MSVVPRFSKHLKNSLIRGGVVDETLLRRRVDQYYLPIYLNLRERVKIHQNEADGPHFVGISAPQGCGKTTLVDFMADLFAEEGKKCAVMSLDDFYLTHADQTALADAHPSNPLLEFRGNAGSHDMELISTTLDSLRSGKPAKPSQESILVPRYDKSKFGGRGDRAPESDWLPIAPGKVDVVLFEGWMLGFHPLARGAAAALESSASASVSTGSVASSTTVTDMKGIAAVDSLLSAGERERETAGAGEQESIFGYGDLHRSMDSWLVLQLKQTQQVFEWRLDAERAQGNGLSEQQVKDFVARFMPAYEAYLPGLYSSGEKETADGAGAGGTFLGGPQRRKNVTEDDILRVEIGADRLPTSPVPFPTGYESP